MHLFMIFSVFKGLGEIEKMTGKKREKIKLFSGKQLILPLIYYCIQTDTILNTHINKNNIILQQISHSSA